MFRVFAFLAVFAFSFDAYAQEHVPTSICLYEPSGMGLNPEEMTLLVGFLQKYFYDLGIEILSTQDKACLPGLKATSNPQRKILSIDLSFLKMASMLQIKVEIKNRSEQETLWSQDKQFDLQGKSLDNDWLNKHVGAAFLADANAPLKPYSKPRQNDAQAFPVSEPSKRVEALEKTKDDKPNQEPTSEEELVDITLASFPSGADVYLDNKKQGVTNLLAKLKPGRYKLTLHKKQYEDFSLSLVVQPKRAKNIELKLIPRIDSKQKTLKIVRWGLVGMTTLSATFWGIYARKATNTHQQIRTSLYNGSYILSREGQSQSRNAKYSAVATAITGVSTTIFWLALEL